MVLEPLNLFPPPFMFALLPPFLLSHSSLGLPNPSCTPLPWLTCFLVGSARRPGLHVRTSSRLDGPTRRG